MSVANEVTQLTPTYAPAENASEPTVFSVPIVAFPKAYEYDQQWAVGLIVAGMMKQAKYRRYAYPFVETFVQLKEPYRQYKYRNALKGANAWLTWFNKFEVPALHRLGRMNINKTK
ncbi:hypothetical protein [Deltalipothrixvirus pozzuoliense]|uniref:Uncharacterized protein ORF115 n=1 Tax=Acidianus filamentous virus 2 (isolate Italy/Pozzuoli) TaxID=654910 RepID=Y115_AFV2P|nr:hypothetical protein AFV2_gp27 [Acidianus filamentous virus 2]Q573E2.1 RecName: Full=Uncharacterized protein ORF115 [Acidianus filamentous virus 2 (isolate Pozzuoli)]CAH69414.1 hypothetical protein [Acidianus filamentous virus 2]